MENKKVKNAVECVVDNIKFKSKWETRVYKLLKEAGLNPLYEPSKITLLSSFRPKVSFYTKQKAGFSLDKRRVRAITYSPDFIVQHNDRVYYIEAKGMKTDSYNIKIKLFRDWLEKNDSNSTLFEVYNINDVKNTILLIKHLNN